MSAARRRRAEPTDLAQLGRRVAALNMDLARERAIPDHVASAVDEIVGAISEVDGEEWLAMPQDLATHVLAAVIDAQRAIILRDRGLPARNSLRSALGRLSQALGLIAEGRAVSPDRSPKELARWLVEAMDVPQRELAAALGVPLRTFQRWASAGESSQPEGADADRLRMLAVVVNQLRFSLSGTGIIRWLGSRNAWLGGKRPRALLGDPLHQPRLVRAARALREGAGS
jgi:hypothetical protein